MNASFSSARVRLFWLSLLLVFTCCWRALASSPTDSLDLFLAAKMQQLRIPGLQLAVVRHGQIVKLAQYGLANVQDSVPVTRRTRFFLNSITKAFVGVAVMQLVEAGKLDLAAPVSRYLAGLPTPWQPVTVRQLLTHTSGLPDILPEEALVTEDNEQAAWAAVQQQPLEFQPGEQFSYNQTNYLLLGKLITQLSSQPFTEFTQTRQFNVVGMRRTTWGDAHAVVPNAARGYSFMARVDGQLRRSPQLRNMFEVFAPSVLPAAGLTSTAEEVAHWLLALQQGKLMQPGSLPVLWTPGVLNNGTQRGFSKLLNGYALGWPTITRPEHPAVAPVGGGRSAIFVYPQDELAIVVLTNLSGANPDRFVDEIAGYYLPDMRPATGFGLPPTIRALHQTLRQRGFSHAVEIAKQAQRQQAGYSLPEVEVNTWGYALLKQAQLQSALEVFKLNVYLYPQSANAYDSLAELYETLGSKALAKKNYQRSLALNPKNTNAAEHLKSL